MKLITLNTWCGRYRRGDDAFYATHQDIDIWCFQEVFKDASGKEDVKQDYSINNMEGFATLKEYLPDNQHEYCQTLGNFYGLASFLTKDIRIIDRGEMLVARGNWEDTSDPFNRDHHRKLQWLELEKNGTKFLVANVHLTHRPEGKMDSAKRLQQSKIIVDFLEMFDCPKILVGDFNLLPETESIALIERAGFRNLIKEFGITSTRTPLYTKQWRLADYVFVSEGIDVIDFKVLTDIVSDHSPVSLEFDIKRI